MTTSVRRLNPEIVMAAAAVGWHQPDPGRRLPFAARSIVGEISVRSASDG